jgi:DHA1 family multidrug resistance protein-like MFS transporter
VLKKITSYPRWQQNLFVLFFSQMATTIGFSLISPFLPLYVKSLGSTTGLSVELLSGLVFSASSFTMMLASPFWGRFADRYGRKYMAARATIGGAIIFFLMASIKSAEQLVVLRACQGLVTGSVAANTALLASQVPRERMGYALGVLQVGIGAGVALGPIIGGTMADEFGYASAFYVTTVMLILAGVVILVGIREDSPKEKSDRENVQGNLAFWKGILKNPGVKSTYSVSFLLQLARGMINPIIALFVVELMVGATRVNSFTGFLMGTRAAAMTLSAMYLGRLADRIGYRKVGVMCALLAGLFYIPQSSVSEEWQLLILMFLVGIAVGGLIPTRSALLAGYTENGMEGAVFGLDNSIRASGSVIAPLLGSFVALSSGLRGTFIATGVVYLFASMVMRFVLPPPSRPRKPEEARRNITHAIPRMGS